MKNLNWTLPLAVAVLLIAFFIGMRQNLANRFDMMNSKLTEGKAICLHSNINTENFANILYVNKYAETYEDASFIVRFIQSKLKEGTKIETLQDLNKRDWQLPDTLIKQQGSEGFRKKLAQSYEDLGQNNQTMELYRQSPLPSSIKMEGNGSGNLTARVIVSDEKDEKTPMPGILVRLDKHSLDSIGNPEYTIIAYAMTDKQGTAAFRGLDLNGSYSLLPICVGYEFGLAKGTTGCTLADLDEDQTICSFTAIPHKIRLFSNNTLQRIREDQTICVRTPEEFMNTFQGWALGFFAVWLLVYICAYKGKPDILMFSLLMAISGLSFLLMFGINDPLTERLLGKDTAIGIIGGVVIIALLQLPKVNIIGLSTWKILSQGYTCLLIAIAITLLLFIPGLGESVGGMNVNLNLGFVKFQPSEIAKFLIVLFIAIFFYHKGERLIRYSDTHSFHVFRYKGKMLSYMAVGIAALLAIYIGLGDMGPAMIITLTFIVLYSLIKSRPGDKNTINDFGTLIIGVLSFLLCIGIGKASHCQILMCGVWLLGWLIAVIVKKQLFESAFLFNLVITVFLFGSDFLQTIGMDNAAQRLEARKEMCVNTWGNLDTESGMLAPGVNTQVAEGLWGLATGGFAGQGFGNGSSNYIPAYHTDMILQSIGEQTGFIGLVIVFVLFSLLLWRTLQTGYRSNHLFAFYLCTGIAVVTAIQLLVITFGSTGFIPLTGITVPMLSYGKVSMILNLAAFGVVLSIATHNNYDNKQRNFMGRYNPTVAAVSLVYTLFTLFALGIFFHYQIIKREKTILRPAVAYNTQGAVAVYYNPRIEKLADKMKPGNIYDRKGVLIATSFPDSLERYKKTYDKYHLDTDIRQIQQRYYPFDEHLFFMLGDYNNKLFFSSLDNSPRGFMAEARYLSILRGYDNRLYDKTGNPVQVDLKSDRYQPARFLPANSEYRQMNYQLRDYSALLPYLKAGLNDDRIERYNARQEQLLDFGKLHPQNLTLTIDAGLQTRLQQELAQTDKAGMKKWHRFQRTSIVVLDAKNGDLLASAVYPLPDYQRLSYETKGYADYYRPDDWQAYTDTDLGIIYPTAPGSTAKIISALAGIRNLENTHTPIMSKQYLVYDKERIHTGRGGDPVGWVDFHSAIVNSSNNYFIHLVNDLELYDELANIYAAAGVRIGQTSSYLIDYEKPDSVWMAQVTGVAPAAIQTYRDYIQERTQNTDTQRRMVFSEPWRWAWGQGTLSATPLAMARIAAAIANNGKMPVTRFLLTDKAPEYIDIAASPQIATLQQAMEDEAHKPLSDGSRRFVQYPNLGGKTGTPERTIKWTKDSTERVNDAWYVCFVNDTASSLAIVVRTERTGNAGSGYAKNLVNKLVMPVLHETGYVK